MARAPQFDDLSADQPVGAAAGVVVRALLEDVVRLAPAVLSGDDTRAVHDLRVAIRRMRSALVTFADALPRKRRKRASRALRRIGGKLGSVRDADVQLAVVRAAFSRASDVDRAGISYVLESIGRSRSTALAKFAIEYSQFDRSIVEDVVDV